MLKESWTELVKKYHNLRKVHRCCIENRKEPGVEKRKRAILNVFPFSQLYSFCKIIFQNRRSTTMKEHYGTYLTYNEILEDYEDIVEIMKPARTFDDLLEIQKKSSNSPSN